MALDINCGCGHDAALHNTEDGGGGCQACRCSRTFGQAVIYNLLSGNQPVEAPRKRDTRRSHKMRDY